MLSNIYIYYTCIYNFFFERERMNGVKSTEQKWNQKQQKLALFAPGEWKREKEQSKKKRSKKEQKKLKLKTNIREVDQETK